MNQPAAELPEAQISPKLSWLCKARRFRGQGEMTSPRRYETRPTESVLACGALYSGDKETDNTLIRGRTPSFRIPRQNLGRVSADVHPFGTNLDNGKHQVDKSAHASKITHKIVLPHVPTS